MEPMIVLMLCIFMVSFIGMLFLMAHFGRWEIDADGVLLFLLTFSMFIVSMGYLSGTILENGKEEGYKRGQIDAIKGDIKYKLKNVEVDSIEKWVKKDKGE